MTTQNLLADVRVHFFQIDLLELAEVRRRPPVDGILALDVVHEQGDGQHDDGAEHDEGDVDPAHAGDLSVCGREDGCSASRRMHGVCDGHDKGGSGAADCSGNPLQVVKVGVQLESFRDGHADDGGQGLSQKGIARLGQGCPDRVVVQNGTGAETRYNHRRVVFGKTRSITVEGADREKTRNGTDE